VSETTLRRIAWALLGFAAACIVAAFVILLVTGESGQGGLFPVLATITFSVVGALVAAGRPRNPIGWLLLTIGLTAALGLPAFALYEWDKDHAGTFTGGALNALLNGTLWLLWIGFLIPRVLLLFPDGRLPSARWRIVSIAQFMALAGLVLSRFRPGPIPDYEEYDNPLGIGALSGVFDVAQHLGVVALALLLFILIAPLIAVIVRFRRSRGVERLQMKWFTWAVAVTAVLWIGGSLLPSERARAIVEPVAILSMCLAPVTIGIAVLRYRLYEIDRLVSRTLVYGALTVVLGGAYVGLVLTGQALFASFAGGSNLAIAASTLIVAALFLPVRSRVQRFVDRRFYRRRYDAQRTLEGFGARLREQIDLGTLERDLRGVVTETMQPAHASVWLRGVSR
jgi:hypothetical protein